MKLEREDYIDPACPLCGKPGETESPRPVPIDRIQRKLLEYEDASDWTGAERHLKYWLAEAEMNRDRRGQLMLHNELMGFYRKQGRKEEAFFHAKTADTLVSDLQMEETVTAGTTWVNAGTVREAFGDPVGGLDWFEKARENYEKNLPENDGRLGGLYNNMALALTSCGRWTHLAEYGRRAGGRARTGRSGGVYWGVPGPGGGTAGYTGSSAERVLRFRVREMRAGLRALRILCRGSGTDETGGGYP